MLFVLFISFWKSVFFVVVVVVSIVWGLSEYFFVIVCAFKYRRYCMVIEKSHRTDDYRASDCAPNIRVYCMRSFSCLSNVQCAVCKYLATDDKTVSLVLNQNNKKGKNIYVYIFVVDCVIFILSLSFSFSLCVVHAGTQCFFMAVKIEEMPRISM